MQEHYKNISNSKPIILDGKNLTISDLYSIAYNNQPVSLADESKSKIIFCRKMVEDKINEGEIVYGINTGIGEFSETVLDDSQIEDFQKYLIYNHSAGIGEPAPIEYIRAAMASRVNVHSNGNSGCRLEITQTIIDMLNKGVTPYVCQKGSVGACGDLAPMAQIALVLLGEGKAYYKG
ncbi:MAG: phenylalanine ammonia-lyase, partial [Candidatus Marinimicrobia bacterium]|nr:phenylalanine ammonia-lyase [Candidatus Neomarinimicrobiota bacterium]